MATVAKALQKLRLAEYCEDCRVPLEEDKACPSCGPASDMRVTYFQRECPRCEFELRSSTLECPLCNRKYRK